MRNAEVTNPTYKISLHFATKLLRDQLESFFLLFLLFNN